MVKILKLSMVLTFESLPFCSLVLILYFVTTALTNVPQNVNDENTLCLALPDVTIGTTIIASARRASPMVSFRIF